MGGVRGRIRSAVYGAPPDLVAGLVLVVFGGLGVMATRGLSFGSAAAMGPGYFPTIVSGLIVLLGFMVVTSSVMFPQDVPSSETDGALPWRAMVLITLAVVGFALFVDDLGLFLAGYGLLLITSLASPQVKLVEVVVFSALLSTVVTMIFSWGLGLNLSVWPT